MCNMSSRARQENVIKCQQSYRNSLMEELLFLRNLLQNKNLDQRSLLNLLRQENKLTEVEPILLLNQTQLRTVRNKVQRLSCSSKKSKKRSKQKKKNLKTSLKKSKKKRLARKKKPSSKTTILQQSKIVTT